MRVIVYLCMFFIHIDRSTIPPEIIFNLDPQSICVENSNPHPNASFIANCLVRNCVQIQGTELMAFSLDFNGTTEWCYLNGTVNNGQLQCPPVRYACARGAINMISPNDPIPPPCEFLK